MGRSLFIKNLVPRKNGHYRQGYFIPDFPEKYLGDRNKIIFRSGYELKFAKFCDLNSKILKWSSETIQVPYHHPIENKIKNYNIDFFIKVLQDDGSTKDYIVEVKPQKKLQKPILEGRKTQKKLESHLYQMKEYLINLEKFTAAKKWAQDRGWEFIIVTEKFLF